MASSSEQLYEEIPEGSHLYRVHPVGKDSLWFGPKPGHSPRHRFDAPAGEYRVCYLAATEVGAFVESFLRLPELAGEGIRILAASELESREVSRIRVTRALRVARLRGPGLSWRGTTAEISASKGYSESRRVALRIHEESPVTAGIAYRCRHDDDQIAVALFDRARKALRAVADGAHNCFELAEELAGYYPFAID